MTVVGREYSSGRAGNPLRGIFTVTPSDSDNLAQVSRMVYAATAGRINATFVDGSTGTFAIAAGERVPVMVTRIWSTSTTATGIEVGH